MREQLWGTMRVNSKWKTELFCDVLWKTQKEIGEFRVHSRREPFTAAPLAIKIEIEADVAQLVEQLIRNQ